MKHRRRVLKILLAGALLFLLLAAAAVLFPGRVLTVDSGPVKVDVMVVLGGLGSLAGSVVAATLLTLVNFFFSYLAAWRMVIYALLLVVLMIFRPHGLWQARRREVKRDVA